MSAKLAKASMKLMLHYEFFSALCLSMPLVEDAGLKPATMATDGVSVLYHPDFIRDTPEDELIGVLAHEGMHKGLGHMFRLEGRDAKLFNVAADLSINHILLDAGMKLPSDRIDLNTIRKHLRGSMSEAIIQKLPFMNVEKIYSYLEQAAQEGGGKGGIPTPNWGNVSMPEGVGPEDVQERLAECDELLKSAADQVESRAKGSIPAGLQALINKMRQPKVDWKNVVWRFIQGDVPFDYSYRRSNKYYVDAGLYLPTIEKRGVGTLAIMVDTSGSVSNTDLEQFLAEMNSISQVVQPATTWVIPCDAAVHENSIVEYSAGDEIVDLKATGRGGTSFKPPFAWLKKNDIVPDKIVYLTDLQGDFPADPEISTLWVTVCPGTAPFGEVVCIETKGA